jgi:hypothetical protein
MQKKKPMQVQKETSPKISRREFLKDAGLIAGGAAISSMALVNACSGETTITEPGGTVTKTLSGTTNTVTTTLTPSGGTGVVTTTVPGPTITQ